MKILICGTNYGASYLRALTFQSTHSIHPILPMGILSTGSERSMAYAKAANVPHYTQLKQLPTHDIDIACIAVPGIAGQQLILGLLQLGVHVIGEHPLDPKFIAQAQELAKQNQRHFFVNAHFADLPAPQALIKAHQQALQYSPCLHYALAVNLRSLYSGLDILGRLIGDLNNLRVSLLSPANDRPSNSQHFVNLLIHAPKISVNLLCQNFTSARDDGSANFVNHRLNTIYNHGSLAMNETYGPVNWQPNMNNPHWQNVMPIETTAINLQQLQQQRDKANLTVLQNMTTLITQQQPCPLEQQHSYQLDLAKLWQSCFELLQLPS